ncbi:MAG: hypothetical protein EPN22_04655 [Nitrospirae bacterium]|nr:MAG: hypothetical protein EPN22_04655 [Nitrospirota bacterium]
MKALIVLLALLFCCISYAEKTYDIEATGDHSVWVIVNDIKSMFIKDTGLSFNLIPELAIVGKGCEKGISLAAKGKNDREFGMICCKLNDATIGNHGLKIYPFALEPLAIIVNKKNPVKGLTLAQIKDIFAGKITNWKDVGGHNDKIVVAAQLHCPLHEANWTKILSRAERFTKNRINIKTQPEMAKTVSDFKQAVGHLEMTSVKESKDKVKVLAVDGYLPTSENMEKGLYPLFATLSITTKGDASGNVVTFIEYIKTNSKVREAMKKYGMSQIK